MNSQANLRQPDQPFTKSGLELVDLIDFCKGIGIILIFSNHLWHSGSNLFNVLGWQGVHIFIVLSGFGLTYSRLKNKNRNFSWKLWYVKRLERIIPTYWITCLIGLILSICFTLIKQKDLTNQLTEIVSNFALEISLIRNLNHETIFANQGHLWFIPFIISFYLFFPFLYKMILKRNILVVGLLVLAIEFLYRAVAIYYLDGVPVAHDSALGLNSLPDSYIFQRGAPFGISLSRIGEFMLGMLGAWFFIARRNEFTKQLLDYKILTGAIITFILGNMLRKVLWGWIFTDFIIAFSLIVLVLNLAYFSKKYLPSICFQKVNELGVLSYYIFLIHISILETYNFLENRFSLKALNGFMFLFIEVTSSILIIVATYFASQGLAKLDKVKFLRSFGRIS